MSLPVTIFVGRTLVVLFLALRQANVKLGTPLVPMELEWHERESLAFDRAGQAIQFVSMQQ